MNLMNDNEKISVMIRLQDVEDSIIQSRMSKEKGMNIDAYESRERFYQEIKPKVIKETEAKLGKVKAHEPIAIANIEDVSLVSSYNVTRKDGLILNNRTYIDEALQQESQLYLCNKRSIIKDEYESNNNEFITKNNINSNDILYKGKYIPYIIVDLSKNEINDLKDDQTVECIDYFENSVYESELNISTEQVGVTGDNGTKYFIPGQWAGYSGLGVKVGIIEVGGVFDPNATMLASNTRLSNIDYVGNNGNIDTHSTLVTSIIAGMYTNYQGVVYEGVALGAYTYQSYVTNDIDIIDTLDYYSSLGVCVVNFSWGFTGPSSSYVAGDRLYDDYFANTGMVCVKSAGNDYTNHYVTAPGKALNIITVGNAATISYSHIALEPGYLISSKSSYVEESYLPNKPDVVAPGTNIRFVYNGSLYQDSGTSYAAPIVTGIIAQMMEADSWLIGKPLAVKNMLILSANSSKMAAYSANDGYGNAYYNNAIVYGMREKSGTGLVSSDRAISYIFDDYQTSLDIDEVTSTTTTEAIYFEEGTKLRAVMTFDKQHDKLIDSAENMDDLDLILIDANGNSIVRYNTARNNVEILEYQIANSGYYKFKVEVKNIVNQTNPPSVCVCYHEE